MLRMAGDPVIESTITKGDAFGLYKKSTSIVNSKAIPSYLIVSLLFFCLLYRYYICDEKELMVLE